MKKFLNKLIISFFIGLCLISTFSLSMPVMAKEIEPDASIQSYVDTNFEFTGGCSIAYNVTGYFMDVTVSATASNNNNETIHLDIYITNRNVTKSYTFYTEGGQEHHFNNIFLGLSGGSPVCFYFTGANPAITISGNLKVVS